MKITPLHEWNLSPKEAIELQKQFAYEVITEDKFDAPVETVAGIDLGYDLKTETSRAVVVVLKFPELELIESAEAVMPIQFPYVPGLLSFRETPVAVKALEKLENAPALILCDGQGIAHRASASFRRRLSHWFDNRRAVNRRRQISARRKIRHARRNPRQHRAARVPQRRSRRRPAHQRQGSAALRFGRSQNQPRNGNRLRPQMHAEIPPAGNDAPRRPFSIVPETMKEEEEKRREGEEEIILC
jgi:hypothetical protein